MNLDPLTFNSEEVQTLSSIVVQELLRVKYDSWSAELLFNGIVLSLTPDEIDVLTPENSYGNIVTLRIERSSASILEYEYSFIENCGKVKNVWCLESSVKIENSRQIEESELIAGVNVPAGMGWNNNIYIPTSHKEGFYKATLGIQIETDNGVWFSLYTDAVGFFVLLHKGDELPEELNGKCEKSKIENNIA